MVISGAIQIALCVFLFVSLLRATNEESAAMSGEFAVLRNIMVLGLIALAVLIVLAAVRLIVGVIDFVPRRTVVGVVADLRERKFGDVLPYMAQRLLFERKENGIDRRKSRFEVVLHTAQGTQQWTVRNARTRRQLTEGANVQLTVSPILGYVARAETR